MVDLNTLSPRFKFHEKKAKPNRYNPEAKIAFFRPGNALILDN